MFVRDLPAVIPGPRPMPLVGWRGNLLRFARDPIGYAVLMEREYGRVAAFVRGGNMPLNSATMNGPGTVFAFGPEFNQQILSDTDLFQSSLLTGLEGTRFARLGNGLLAMNGGKHKQQRRLLMPFFQKKRVEAYHAAMVAITQDTLDQWRIGERRDLFKDFRQLTLRIATRVLFGIDASDPDGTLSHAIEDWLQLFGAPAVLFFPYNFPGVPFRRYLRASHRLETALLELIARKRSEKEPHDDVLSQMVHARDDEGGSLTEDELIGQANLLFLAGHETTANALTWTVFLLAQHPAVMAELWEELHGQLHDDPPTLAKLADLPLLERVIKESMRILPPVPFGSRTAMEPVRVGPFDLPQYTEVAFSQYVTHRLPELYPDPDKFLPERWLNFEPSPYEYLPFGAGSRMCIGATFAMMEIKIILATLLQRYRLALVPHARLDRYTNLTMSPRQGMPMLVRAADRDFAASRAEIRGNVREMVL